MNTPVTRKMAWLLLSLFVSLPAASQEAEPEEPAPAEPVEKAPEAEAAPEPRWGKVRLDIDAWFAQATGLQYRPAVALSVDDPFDQTILEMPSGSENKFRYRVGFEVRDDLGDVVVTYFSHKTASDLTMLTAGDFLFSETLTVPFEQGVNGDGRADGFAASAVTDLRDMRLDYFHRALAGPRVQGKWFVGYRRVQHRRSIDGTYYALAPNLPPLIPPLSGPRDDLVPQPDTARVDSDYEGRGAEAGFELAIPLGGKRFSLETGFTLAVLRGNVDARYESSTFLYARTQDGAIVEILEPPYDEFEAFDPSTGAPVVASIQQLVGLAGMSVPSESMTSQVLETYLGLRFRVWRTLEAVVGFRNARYDDVGLDLRPSGVVRDTDPTVDEFTFDNRGIVRLFSTGAQETRHSVDYEGFYLGMTYRY
jgi:hypothetical protein